MPIILVIPINWTSKKIGTDSLTDSQLVDENLIQRVELVVKEWGWLCQTVWEFGYDFDIVSETGLAEAEVDKPQPYIASKRRRLFRSPAPVLFSASGRNGGRVDAVHQGAGRLFDRHRSGALPAQRSDWLRSLPA